MSTNNHPSAGSLPAMPAPTPAGRPEKANKIVDPHPFCPSAPLPPLQPLPRGRPKKSKPEPPAKRYKGPVPPQTTEPIQEHFHTGMLTRQSGGQMAAFTGRNSVNPVFSSDGRLIVLTGALNIQGWTQQTLHMAQQLSCHEALTQRPTAFPAPSTVDHFVCEARRTAAWQILKGTISGAVWAYMRVLGFSSPFHSPAATASDGYHYARLAASRMLIPGSGEQPFEERMRMAREVLAAEAADYPNDRAFKKGIKWLRDACDNHIRQGDYAVAEALYYPVPDWAPKPPVATPPAPMLYLGAAENGVGTAGSPIEVDSTPAPREAGPRTAGETPASSTRVETKTMTPPPADGQTTFWTPSEANQAASTSLNSTRPVPTYSGESDASTKVATHEPTAGTPTQPGSAQVIPQKRTAPESDEEAVDDADNNAGGDGEAKEEADDTPKD